MMREVIVYGKGHPNITAKHKTTLEFSADRYISKRADCVISVFSKIHHVAELKHLVSQKRKLKFTLSCDGVSDTFIAYGHPDITISEGLVIRKSRFIDSRTLAVASEKSASEISSALIEKLKNPEALLFVKIEVLEPYERLDFIEGLSLFDKCIG